MREVERLVGPVTGAACRLLFPFGRGQMRQALCRDVYRERGAHHLQGAPVYVAERGSEGVVPLDNVVDAARKSIAIQRTLQSQSFGNVVNRFSGSSLSRNQSLCWVKVSGYFNGSATGSGSAIASMFMSLTISVQVRYGRRGVLADDRSSRNRGPGGLQMLRTRG